MTAPSATPLTVDGVPVARIIALLRTRKVPTVADELDITVRTVYMAVQLYRQHREAVDAEIREAG